MASLEEHKSALSANVELLVESVSNLVLCTVTGDLGEMKTHCEGIALYTDKVVVRAKDIAIASKDKETQVEVTKCINGVASSIEKLVTAFVGLVSNMSDKAAKKAFASAAKDVGIAINDLIVSADTVSSNRLIKSVNDAIEAEKLFLKSVTATDDVLVQSARHFGGTALNVKKLSEQTSSGTANNNKAAILSHSSKVLAASTQEFIRSVNEVHKDATPENKSELAAQYKSLLRLFSEISEAATMKADYAGRLNAAFDEFNHLLDSAKTLKSAIASLADLVLAGCTADEFMAAAKQAVAATGSLIQQALKAMEEEKDPVRKEQIRLAIGELKEQSGAYMKSARTVQQNPSDEALKAAMMEDKKHMEAGTDKLVALTSKGMEEEKLYHTSKYLDAVCAEMMSKAATLSGEELAAYAAKISDITERVVKDAKAVAMKTSDPTKRERILQSTTNLQKAGDRYVGDIGNLSRKPGDKVLLDRLGNTHHIFVDQVRKVRVAAGLEKAKARQGVSMSDDDNELLRAAKVQAQAALSMADDAELMLPHIKVPAKKAQLTAAIERLRGAAADVIKFAEQAAADPDNLDLQLKLDEAQRQLADTLKEVVGLTSSAAGELSQLFESMLAGDGANIGEVFRLAKQLLADVEKFTATAPTAEPKQVVMSAKQITQDTGKVSKLIRQVADDTTDPSYKEQLVHFSRFMRDRATQVKMIAAVKVACGGDAGQVTAAADGLHSTVSECVSVLTASELKRRRKATTDRADQVRHILEVWRRCKTA